LRAPGVTGERFRFRESGSNLAFDAAKVTMLPGVALGPVRFRIGIEAAACCGQPVGHLVIASWHPDRGLMRR
jgi:hypothetical protein